MGTLTWPWHVKVVKTDGTSTEDDYSTEFDAISYAKHASDRASVERIEVSVTFVNGEPVEHTPAIVAAAGQEG